MLRQGSLGIACGLFVAMAAQSAQAVPAVGLAGTTLFSFDTSAPAATSGAVGISGLQSNETIYGIDFRPATSALYGLGSSGTLYTINTTSGAATVASMLSSSLLGSSFDISFNPTVDRLRIVGTSNQDLRVNVDTGAVTVDGNLAYAAGDANAGRTPGVAAAGYTNQVANATSTTLYDLDAANATLVTQNPPNNGTLNTVGTLAPTGLTGFDISGTSGAAFAATNSALYSVNLATGGTSLLGGFGRSDVTDFALAPQAVPEPITIGLLGLAAVGLIASRHRRPRFAAAA